MIDVPYIGITGVAGAGKDTVYDRLRALGGDRFVRLSVADPLKDSIAALFGVSLEHLEVLKRDPQAFVQVRSGIAENGRKKKLGTELYRVVDFSMRQFMQRYGTESHRDVFGEDFWVDAWERKSEVMHFEAGRTTLDAAVKGWSPLTVVNTSVRFRNEAARIHKLGGVVWHVEGPQDDGAAGHESESELPSNMIDARIDNTFRGNDFEALDDQIATLLHGGTQR